MSIEDRDWYREELARRNKIKPAHKWGNRHSYLSTRDKKKVQRLLDDATKKVKRNKLIANLALFSALSIIAALALTAALKLA